MTKDHYQHPVFVELARALRITVSSEDEQQVFRILRQYYEQGVQAGVMTERARAAEYLDRNLMSARDYAVVIGSGEYQ